MKSHAETSTRHFCSFIYGEDFLFLSDFVGSIEPFGSLRISKDFICYLLADLANEKIDQHDQEQLT